MNAVLKRNLSSIEFREAIYQCASIIGFPHILNAIASINEIFIVKTFNCP